MTTKKTYCETSLQEVMLDRSGLIATNGDSSIRVSLGLFDETEEEGYAA